MIDFLDFLEYAVVGGDGMPRKKPPVTVRGVTKDPEKKTDGAKVITSLRIVAI